MIQTTQTFLIASMNTAAGHAIDVRYTTTRVIGGDTQTETFYPRSMILTNTSGAAVEIAILSTTDEIAAHTANPANVGYMYIPTSITLNLSKIGRAMTVVVRQIQGGSATTSNLRIDFYGFAQVLQ